MSYFNEDGAKATTTDLGLVKVPAGSGVNVDSTGSLTNTDKGSAQNIFKNISIQGDGTAVASTNNDTLTFAPGGRMFLNVTPGTNIITITDNAKGHKKHKIKDKSGLYTQLDIDAVGPEDTITFEEGNGVTIYSNTATQTITFTSSLVGTSLQISVSTTTGVISLANSVVMPGSLTLAAGTISVAPLKLTTGSLLSAPLTGSIEYDGNILYVTPRDAQRGVVPVEQMFVLNSDRIGLNQTAAQSLFGVEVSLSSNIRYFYEIICDISKTTNTAALLYSVGGTASMTRHSYTVVGSPTAPGTTVGNASTMQTTITSGFTTQAPITLTDTTSSDYNIRLLGIIDINAGGTFEPRIGFTSGSSPGTVTIGALSRIRIWPVGSTGANTQVGNWV